MATKTLSKPTRPAKQKTKLFLFRMWGCTEPELHGPYKNDEARIKAAKKLEADDGGNGEHCYARLDIDAKGKPNIASFLSGELDEENNEGNASQDD